MEIVNNSIVLIKTGNPESYKLIPKSKVIEDHGDGQHTVAVYFGLDEMRVLKNLGVQNVVSPITKQYDWPGRYKPMSHQIETASFLTLHRRAFCFNEAGTGKTLSALWAADYLIRKKQVRRVLVLCPLSIMQSAWMGDVINSIMHRSAVVAHHVDPIKRKKLVRGDYEIVISNYDGLLLIKDEIIRDGRFDLIIVDEANNYKNPDTVRWKTLYAIVKPDTYLWLMTGTPAAQSPEDAYGLAKLINPSAIPPYKTSWKHKVMRNITRHIWVPRPEARDLVHKVLQPAIRFTKAQCLDLPPVTLTTRSVPMSAQQKKYYSLLKKQMLIRASGETISAVNAAVMVNKLLQVSAGAAYTETKEVIEFDVRARLNLLLEILAETDRKVLIFAMFRSCIETITSFLEEYKISTAQIHGGVSANKRGDIINDFQYTDNVKVLVMQPQATAHGITLTAADTVVFYGPLMSVEQYLQCIARADRKGQTSDKVTVVHIQSSPIEEKLFKALSTKVETHAMIAELFDNEIKNS